GASFIYGPTTSHRQLNPVNPTHFLHVVRSSEKRRKRSLTTEEERKDLTIAVAFEAKIHGGGEETAVVRTETVAFRRLTSMLFRHRS
ncbi:unnamed protein product, partial [Brassica oleracea]